MPRRYVSRANARLPIVWERLQVHERKIIAELGGLPAGATMVPAQNFSPGQLQQLIRGLRLVASLADECRFALGYRKDPRAQA